MPPPTPTKSFSIQCAIFTVVDSSKFISKRFDKALIMLTQVAADEERPIPIGKSLSIFTTTFLISTL